MRLKQISHIRRVVKGIDSSNREKCTIEVFDHTEVSLHDKNTSSSSEEREKLTIVSAILKKRPKKNQTEKKIDNTLFVFWLESYESLIKDLLLSKTAQLENLGFVYAQNSDRTSKTILKNELWSLYHENSVICSSWKKNYGFPTAINKLFLVTLTRYYMAYIWRFNELQDSFEICIQIPLQNDNYTLNFHCLWMNIESVVSDYNFSKRAFLIFYNTTNTRCYSISTEDLDSDYSYELKSGESDIYLPNLNTDAYSVGSQDEAEELYDDTGEEYDNILFHKYEDYVQHFEIYAVDGLFNHRLAVTSEYLLGSSELTMPVKIKSIESVCICDHTFETGLVTLYTSDSLRPNKITTKSPIVVSKWITLKSTNLSNFYKSNHHNVNSSSHKSNNNNVNNNVTCGKDNESLDELIGMQISKGLNKILPPVKLSLLNENDISMNLLLSPYDLFLKDEHIRESVDNIVGLVIRYMFHPSTPLYINVNNELVYIENYFINKIKGSKKVKNVKVFSGKDETLYIIHSKSGALSAITSKKHDPNDITHHQIHNLSHVVTFQVIEYHHQLYFIIFTPYDRESVLLTPYDNESVLLTPYHNESVLLTPFFKEMGKNDPGDDFVQNDGSLYVCGFYKWENYKLNLKGSWLFQCPHQSNHYESPNGLPNGSPDDHLDDAIIQFKKWYDSNYFCLLSKFKLISPNELDSADNSDSGVVYLYMIKSHKIIKWLEISSRYYYDLLTQDRYYLANTSGRNEYVIDDLKILIKSRPLRDVCPTASEYKNDTDFGDMENSTSSYSEDVVGELPLFTGCNFKNKMYPVYHPECVLAMLKLGLNTLVSKLVNMLVFLFRRILSQLKDNIYCTNSNPYSEEQRADVAEDVSGGCNCIIFKTLALKLFCRFNRFFYDYIIKTIYMSNMTHGAQNFEDNHDAEEPKKTILNDYVVDDEYNQYFKEYCSFRKENELLMNELIVYLQVLRLIGLSWYEQYQLINILTKYLSTSDDLLLFNSNRDLENVIGSIESAREQDDEDDDLCKLCQNSNILLRIGMEQNSQLVTPDHNILKYLISYMTSLSPSFFSTFPQNKNLTDLDNVFFTKYKDHLDDKFKVNQHIFKDEAVTLSRDEEGEENFLIWLLLVKNDHNLLIELDHYYNSTVQTGDSVVSYTEYMDMINVGYWVKNKTSFKFMFENVEKYFRLKVKTYRNIEDFDQFGFYLILQGKVKIFSLLLKSKGFEKFSNFLTNDFTQERWKDASVKNAFALISQRRYLLSSAMLILANRIQDAVDVVHQYLNNLSLSILISKLFNFSLHHTFNKVQNRKIKYILLHTHSIDLSPEYSSDISTLTGSSNPKDQDSGSLNTKNSKELMNKNLHVEDPLSKQVELLCHNDDDSDSNPYSTTYNPMHLKHSFNAVHSTGIYGKQNYNNCLYLKHTYENMYGNGSLTEEIRGYKTIGHDSRILEEGILDLLSGTVDELILNVSIGIVLKKLDLFQVEQMIRNSSRYYLDKMPMISALLHSFVVNYTSWDKILIYASNFLHFQKFNNFNQKYDYLDYTNQGLNDSYCNSNYYVDDYKYLDGNVLVEFNNYTFKQSHLKCPILKKLSSIISTKHLQKPSKGSQHSLFSFSSPQSGQHSGSSLDDQGDFVRTGDEIFVMNEESDLVVNVNTLSVVEVLLKIKSTLKMELTLNYYKINSIISIRKYDIDIESIYTRLVNTFIGFLDSNLSVQEFNIPSLQLNLINKLALLAIHSSNLDNSKENEPGTLESERQPDIEVKDRLDVGLYDSDLSLVNEEIVCVCFVVSLTCVFMLVLYKVDILPQVYNGLYTQLTLLNQMKGNNEWLKQFLESVINTIEPSLFANDTFDAEKFNILSTSNKNTKTQHQDELQLQE
ncbi:RAVE protein 1 C terminal family protein [Theileria parva strain Muguga]|uniref:RAVE protein 1 C terminal family protein n=1 Tax=Theileria parva strain Muguga TaxID=333668 RepID=UPI001C61E278|nr:RAVE protein 1 C terminal family protein [Theileria parva strain Muguga]EAN31210.2 RAVE protein 1 C terminal family protein [Theileria parva strain Muguga]